MRFVLPIFSVVIGFSCGTNYAQVAELVVPVQPKLRKFETLDYPLLAKQARVEGVVVIQAHLDALGNVKSAVPLSGSKYLIPASVANAKKWQFETEQNNSTLLIYEFRFEGVCKRPCSTLFVIRPPNHAVILTGSPLVE